MSFNTTYHSFRTERADRAWMNLDEMLRATQDTKRRIEEIDTLMQENALTDDEIYNPTLAEQKEVKTKTLRTLSEERAALKAANPLIDTWFFYHLDTKLRLRTTRGSISWRRISRLVDHQ